MMVDTFPGMVAGQSLPGTMMAVGILVHHDVMRHGPATVIPNEDYTAGYSIPHPPAYGLGYIITIRHASMAGNTIFDLDQRDQARRMARQHCRTIIAGPTCIRPWGRFSLTWWRTISWQCTGDWSDGVP